MTQSKFKYRFLVSFSTIYKNNETGFSSVPISSKTKLLDVFSKNGSNGTVEEQILKHDSDLKSVIIIAISPIYNDCKELERIKRTEFKEYNPKIGDDIYNKDW